MIRFLNFVVCQLLVLCYFIQFQQYLGVSDSVPLSSSFFNQASQYVPLIGC